MVKCNLGLVFEFDMIIANSIMNAWSSTLLGRWSRSAVISRVIGSFGFFYKSISMFIRAEFDSPESSVHGIHVRMLGRVRNGCHDVVRITFMDFFG